MNKISKIWSPLEKKWYDELRLIYSYREYQYDNTIQSTLSTLFPEFIPVKYHKRIKASGTPKSSIPDFALIREDYREWWIVEVERIEDNINHVKLQIENFTNGDYNSVVQAEYLKRNNSSLDLKRLKNLTQETPKVLLLVDDITSKWISELEEFEPTTCILKQYRNSEGSELLTISGDYPYIFEAESHCAFSDSMNNLLRVSNPDILSPIIDKLKKPWYIKIIDIFKSPKESTDETYKIYHKGRATEWAVVRTDKDVYLQPIGPHALRVNDPYVLKRTSSQSYVITIN